MYATAIAKNEAGRREIADTLVARLQSPDFWAQPAAERRSEVEYYERVLWPLREPILTWWPDMELDWSIPSRPSFWNRPGGRPRDKHNPWDDRKDIDRDLVPYEAQVRRPLDESDFFDDLIPVEVEIDPLPRRLVFAVLAAADDNAPEAITVRPPDPEMFIEVPMREYAAALATKQTLTEAADRFEDHLNEVDEGVKRGFADRGFKQLSQDTRCKGRPGQKGFCGGPAIYKRPGSRYYECTSPWCGSAHVSPGECGSCGESLYAIKAPRGTIVCLDPACGKTSTWVDPNAKARGLPVAPQASGAAMESKVQRALAGEVEQHLDAMLASDKWGARTQVALYIASGQAEHAARRRMRLKPKPPAEWVQEEAARHANEEGLIPPYGTEWTQHKVERGVKAVRDELLKRLELDETTGYREMVAKLRRHGGQRLLDALEQRFQDEPRLRPLGKELGLIQG